MTRLSDAAIVSLFTVAECMLDGRIRASADEKRLCTGLLQLRDDLDAVTKERDFMLRPQVGVYEVVLGWCCHIGPIHGFGTETQRFYVHGSDKTPLDALRAALAAPAPTPEGSK